MSDPQSFTSAQAADPQTPAQVLADIAALRPDLRPVVAANPSTYPGLLEWLGSLGEPSVDAAIAARQQAAPTPPQRPSPAAQQPAYPPQQPAYPPQQPAYPPQQPAYRPPASGPATTLPTTPLPPQGQYGAGPATAPPGGQPPMGAGGYGYGYGAPPPKKSHKALWIVLAVVGVLILLGVVAVILIANAVRGAIAEYGTYGSDTSLDRLWDRCEGGDWQACDDLYFEAPWGSEYESFGDTCGNRTSGFDSCVDEFGGGTSTGDANTFGDSALLDALWMSCEGGDWQACDDLYWDAPVGSEYEAFGDTCGNRSSGSGSCVAEFGDGGTSSEPYDYGDDPYLDGLWSACEQGGWQACDDLFNESPSGSIYRAYGDTCGDRQPEGTGRFCVDSMG